jgi:hypothetical protein
MSEAETRRPSKRSAAKVADPKPEAICRSAKTVFGSPAAGLGPRVDLALGHDFGRGMGEFRGRAKLQHLAYEPMRHRYA